MFSHGRTSHLRIAIALAAAVMAWPLSAQQSTDQRIGQLEKRLNELTQQVSQIRSELDQLKGSSPTAAPAPVPPSAQEDLTKVDVVTSQQPAPTPQQTPAQQGQEQPATALTDVQTINNQVNPGASKIFNPDTSVIGNFLGHAGGANPFEYGRNAMRPAGSFDEAEVGFEAFVDPYAKAKFFLTFTPDTVDVEEGYAQFVTLPYDLTAKVGKEKAFFGKANTWHTHVRPWIDQPLVIHNFFGDEQLTDSGISVSKTFPQINWAFVEATGEVFGGNVPGVFATHNQNDLFYNTHLKLFKDITENSNVELGTSYARGTLPTTGGSNQFGGIDVTYRWKPLQQGLYRSLIGRFEGIANDRADFDKRLYGFYTSLDYQLGQRWFTGVRLDRADRSHLVGDAADMTPLGLFTDKGASATLTFWPSEFSQVRGQLRRTSYGGAKSVNELLLQLQFSIGAHGAHTF